MSELQSDDVNVDNLLISRKCDVCYQTNFVETLDCETFHESCTNCGNIQFVPTYVNLSKLKEHGRTAYDPMTRFEFWIKLANGDAKLPKQLKDFVDKCNSNTQLKEFLNKKENRIHRKYYGCVLKQWEPELVPSLSSHEIECLKNGFSHIRSSFKYIYKSEANVKIQRKKSLPHYVYIITFLLNYIQRQDLASNFFLLRCKSIEEKYASYFKEMFPR